MFGRVQSAQIKDQMSHGKIWKRKPELLRHTKTEILLSTVLSFTKVLQSFTELSGKDDLHLFWVSSSTLKAKYLQCSQGIVWEGDTVTSGNWPRQGEHTRVPALSSYTHKVVSPACSQPLATVQLYRSVKCMQITPKHALSTHTHTNIHKSLCAAVQNTPTDK